MAWIIVLSAMSITIAIGHVLAFLANRREQRRLDCVIELMVTWADHWGESEAATRSALHQVLAKYADVLVEQTARQEEGHHDPSGA